MIKQGKGAGQERTYKGTDNGGNNRVTIDQHLLSKGRPSTRTARRAQGEEVHTGQESDRTALRQAPPLRVHLLGAFTVCVGDRAVDDFEWYLRKAKNLLKLLALASNHRLHRGQLTDTLWPELDGDAATNNLHKALHVARRVLEPNLPAKTPSSYLHMSGEFVSLECEGSLWIDAEAFRQSAQKAQVAQDPAAYEEALALYGGELLPEDRYEDWASRPREELDSVRGALLLDLAQLHERRGETEEAIEALRRIVATDPAHEQAQGALMRLLANSGHRHLALRQYQQLCEALREELDAEPEPAIQRTYQQILSGEYASEKDVATTPPAAQQPADPQVLIGREQDLARSHEILDDLFAARGALLFLSGPAGVGKSRIAAEFEAQAQVRGAITLWGAAYKLKKPARYGPLAAALEGFAIRVAPEALQSLVGEFGADLVSLVPAIARVVEQDEQATGRSQQDDAAIVAALTHVFTQLTEYAPVVLVLEDLHAADEATILFLSHLARLIPDLPLAVVCTFRSDEVAADGALDVMCERLQRDHLGEFRQLRPLRADEMDLLTTRLLGGPADQAVLEVVRKLAQGNPYFAAETAKALQGRSRIRKVNGVWQVRNGIEIEWDRGDVRQRASASGDFRLAAQLRAS